MYSRIRQQFSTSALVLSVIALVLAAAGGAYAAKQAGLNSKQKKEVTKIAKGLQGKGPAGAQGAPGAKGDAGAKGDTGAAGNSAVVTKVDPGKSQCSFNGGAIVTVKNEAGSGAEVCNGEEGEEGSPWTAGGVLPPGQTETGAWAFTASDADTLILAPISFPIPLASELTEEDVHYQGEAKTVVEEEEFEDVCPSILVNIPEAEPGQLCVYYNKFGGEPVNATFTNIAPLSTLEESGSGRPGAIVQFSFSGGAGETAHGVGSWAVTAPEAP